MNISLKPDVIFNIAGLGITNTLFTSFFVVLIIIILMFFFRTKLSYKKPTKMQIVLEMVVLSLYGLTKDTLNEKYARRLFGFLFTFFIFILISNWFGLTPIVQSTIINTEASSSATETDATKETTTNISPAKCFNDKECTYTLDGPKKFEKEAHLFRPPTSDLSMTVSLAAISVIVTNIMGFGVLKFQYLKKYINFSSPINFVVGILESVSELGKIISFSFRLFGNVFAGEVLLSVITALTFGVATLPFFLLEIFVGALQAFVFFILTSVFIGLAINKHE